MTENLPELELARAAESRRRFLARNCLAMGAIATSVMLTKVKPARAAALCFLKGTRIRTVERERKVESLEIGDLLPAMFGGVRPIQWIGRYSYKKSDPSKPWVKAVLPVRIARSALAPDVPHADLVVTRAHAIYIEGGLVPAGSLINGKTITVYDADECDELEFFHIKLESHDVIYAEGAPVETLLNVKENAVNFAEYLRRYGTTVAAEAPCLPLIAYKGGRNALKSRVRSAISPWFDRREPVDVIRDRLEERGWLHADRLP
jgi:hypothetical protein